MEIKKAAIVISVFLLTTISWSTSAVYAFPEDPSSATTTVEQEEEQIYQKLNFPGLSREAFSYAYRGQQAIADSLKLCQRYLMIADFTLPSSQKRFYLVDFSDTQVVYHDYVAHGRNSGETYASTFSNRPESRQSSLGFYRVSECYTGQHGLSIRLDGLDQSYNDNARARAIVMHTAEYAKPSFIESNGRMGRSWGCPVLPPEGFNLYASTISGNSLLFIYFPDDAYLKNSIWLH